MPATEPYINEHLVESEYVEVEHHVPKWRDAYERLHRWETWFCLDRTVSTEEGTSRARDLNDEIDEIYAILANFIASRHTDSPNEALEEQISQHFHRLRELQQQEADRITALIESHRAGPIGKALDILDHFDEIRAKYGNTSAKEW
jgi:hypothetical protein